MRRLFRWLLNAMTTLALALLVASPWARSYAAPPAYNGWVHVVSTIGGGAPNTTRHVNMADGTVVSQGTSRGRRWVSYQSPATGIWQSWTEETNEIRVQAIGPDDAAELRAGADPLTLGDAMKGIRLALATTQPHVEEARDGDLQRFEITPAADAAHTSTARVTVWVDPTTQRIRRVRTEPVARRRDDGTSKLASVGAEQSYSYGDPTFADIYAAGVPRTAAVVDMRPDPATAEALARVRHVVAPAALGDHVAVLTQSGHTPDGKPIEGGILMVLGRRGDRLFRREYGIVRPGQPAAAGEIPPPQGWPTPTPEDVRLAAKGRVADVTEIGEAGQMRRWELDARTGRYDVRTSGRACDGDPVMAYAFPMKWQFTSTTPNERLSLITDDAHPNLKGLRRQPVLSTQALAPGHAPQAGAPEAFDQGPGTVIWLDPARGWLPVAYDDYHALHTPGGRQWLKQVTTYDTYEKLADGTPYPARWSEPSHWPGMPEPPGLNATHDVVEWRLHIEQRSPADEWFVPPGAPTP